MTVFKWPFLVIMLCFSFETKAQQGHYIGLQSGMTVYFKSSNKYYFNQHSNQNYTFDLSYEYYSKSPFFMGARLSFAQSAIHFQGITRPKNQFHFSRLEPGVGVGSVKFINNFYSIPMFIGYSELFNKIGFTSNIGLIPTLIHHSISTNSNSSYSFVFGGQLEVGAIVMIKDKIKITPSVNCYIDFGEKFNFSDRLHQPFGLNLGISYPLQ